jgi:hypothetical protein
LLCNADAAAAQLAHLHCPQEWLEIQKERERERTGSRERERQEERERGLLVLKSVRIKEG